MHKVGMVAFKKWQVKTMNNNQTIFIVPVTENRPVKIVFEGEHSCPIAYQLGCDHNCKHAKWDVQNMNIVLSCSCIGCKECFLKLIDGIAIR